jgi:hypothetical protein
LQHLRSEPTSRGPGDGRHHEVSGQEVETESKRGEKRSREAVAEEILGFYLHEREGAEAENSPGSLDTTEGQNQGDDLPQERRES